MGHRSTQFPGPSYLHPTPSIYDGNVTNIPWPNVPLATADLRTTYNFNYQPEHHDGALFYGMPQYNAVQQHQNSVSHPDLAIGTPFVLHNPYMAPPFCIGDIPIGPIPPNHREYYQLTSASTSGIVSIPMVRPESNIAYMDSIRGSLRNAEGVPVNYRYHNASAGSSRSVSPMTAPPAEHDDASTRPDNRRNEPTTSTMENDSYISDRRGSGRGLPEFFLANNGSHLIQGSYINLPSIPDQVPDSLIWTRAPRAPHVHASVSGACVDAENVGNQDFQMTADGRSASDSPHLSITQVLPDLNYLPLPMQGSRGYNNFFSQLATSPDRISTLSNPHRGIFGAEQTLPASFPPTGFQFYGPQQIEVMLNSFTRWHQNLPELRLPPEQELLPFGEQIGIVGTGISEEDILHCMKTRTFSLMESCSKHQEEQQQSNFCVICQTDFENQENIGILDCMHEYHRDCIKKWLVIKNTCPLCKSTALTVKKQL